MSVSDLVSPGRAPWSAPVLYGPPPAVPNADLDLLLEEVAASLQLTATQYDRARESYEATSTWLAAPDSPLAPYEPYVYPQGSMPLLTTVRPWRDGEYDVDAVCQLQPTGLSAMALYEAVYRRLAAHGTYRAMLERKERCIRLNYAGQYHIDLIPAEPASRAGAPWGDTAIRIPDRARAGWTPSNPKGYLAWFHEQANTVPLIKAREADPMPPRTTVADNTVLSLVVQLVKRHRDVHFGDDDALAPRSIILTTLAGRVYDGEQSTALALRQIAWGIAAAVEHALPGRVLVANPTNPEERFCDKFTDASYRAFMDFTRRLKADVDALVAATGTGLPGLKPGLDRLFGFEPVQKAFTRYGERHAEARASGRLRTGGGGGAAGLTIASTSGTGAAALGGRSVPANRFFGGGR